MIFVVALTSPSGFSGSSPVVSSPPSGMEFGGCCSFMMVPGYLSTTAEETALKQSLAMQSEGEKSDADLVKLLGASQIVAPITDDQVYQMFHTLSKFFEILVGKQP